MSKVTYFKCDVCNKLIALHSEDSAAVITIMRVAPNLPHGDFCSIPCTIKYLSNFKYND